MTTASHSLAALLGSRICHDLVSPIGAISNGVELMQMAGASDGPELDLIFESVKNANARIRFFRIAFGLASDSQSLGLNEILDILRDVTDGTRTTITWHSDTTLPRRDVKLAFLAIQCMETALPWGGETTITQHGTSWSITGESDRMKDVGALWQAITHPEKAHDLSAAEVQFLLLPVLLAESGRVPVVDVTSGSVRIRF